MEGKEQKVTPAEEGNDHNDNSKDHHVMEERNVHQVPTVSFVITGFGKFGNITHNPTTVIVKHLESKLDPSKNSNEENDDTDNNEKSAKKSSNNSKCLVSMCRVVQTSASSVTRALDEIMKQVEEEPKLGDDYSQDQDQADKNHLVLIHLGVDYKATKFQLETTAFNEASFRIPDEEGFQPKKQPIDDSLPISERLTTSLNARKICADMEQRGFDVKISGDAGRFVCNYIYWSSLNKIKNKMQSKQIDTEKSEVSEATAEFQNRIPNRGSSNIHSIFIHVPLFRVIDQETQFCFVENLLDSIHKDITSPKKKKRKSKNNKQKENI